MAVNLTVAITENEWFDFLRNRPDLVEVNFWSPTPINSRALSPGELLLFKLKSPRNVIAGGGIFAHSNIIPCSLAWKAFGEANGAESFAELRERISGKRSDRSNILEDFNIGCRILTQPFFLSEEEWLPAPSDFKSNIVRFKTYSTNETEARSLWKLLSDRVITSPQFTYHDNPGLSEDDGRLRFGDPQLIRPRLGQGAFRILVTDIYDR